MTKCIGIVSYLPSDKKLRERRWDKLINLLYTCNKLFKLDVIIESQCWSYFEISVIKSYFNNVTIYYNQDKLGIVGARKRLREHFLASNYDVIILLDDDCEIKGTKEDARDYLKQIDDNPDMFYEFSGTLLKLFAISKKMFEQVEFEEINPETGEGFEDRLFVNKLRMMFPTKRYIFNRSNLHDESISTRDKDSTWYVDQDIKRMLDNTDKILASCVAKLNE